MVWISTSAFNQRVEQTANQCIIPKQIISNMANTFLEHAKLLNIGSQPSYFRLSSIICGIGSASFNVPILKKMLYAGMNLAYVKLTDEPFEHDLMFLTNIKTAIMEYYEEIEENACVATAFELRSPSIRTGVNDGGLAADLELVTGNEVILTTDPYYTDKCTEDIIYVNFNNLETLIQVGNKIYINDRKLSFICTEVNDQNIICKILSGGILASRRKVYIPDVPLLRTHLTKKIKEDLCFAIEHNADMVILSAINSATTLRKVRSILDGSSKKLFVISQIETLQEILDIESILLHTDAILLNRKKLASNLDAEKVLIAQKSIIAKCNNIGKPFICRSQILETMQKCSKPTASEASDLANAILDGADGIMLTLVTSQGNDPERSIEVADVIIREAEAAVWQTKILNDIMYCLTPPIDAAHSLCIAAIQLSFKVLGRAIIVLTSSGKTACILSRLKPRCLIVAVTRNTTIAKKLHLYRAILPLLYVTPKEKSWQKDVDKRVQFAIRFGVQQKILRSGDPIVVLTSSEQGKGFNNKLQTLFVSRQFGQNAKCIC